MKNKKQIKEWLLKHCVDKNGNLDLSSLDFSDFDGDVYIYGMIVKRNLYQNMQLVNGNLNQDVQKVNGHLYQSFQKVKRNLYQSFQKVDESLYQYAQEVKDEIIQDKLKEEIK